MAAQPNPPAAPDDQSIRQGLLNLEVTLSHQDPTAGSQFSVYVLITNPFDVPIWVQTVNVTLPSEIQAEFPEVLYQSRAQPMPNLEDVQQRLEAVLGEAEPASPTLGQRLRAFFRRSQLGPVELEWMGRLKQLVEEALRVSQRLEAIEAEIREIYTRWGQLEGAASENPEDDSATAQAIERLTGRLATLSDEQERYFTRLSTLKSLMLAITNSAAVSAQGNLMIDRATLSQRFYFEARGDVEMTNIRNLAEVKTRSEELDPSSLPPKTDALHPGETAVYRALLKTKATVFFRPIQYMLHFNVLYTFSPEPSRVPDPRWLHANTTAKSILIRAPIQSVMLGAAIGGLAGFFARQAQLISSGGAAPFGLGEMAVSAFLTVVLSVVAVVFVARKSEAQSVVSVEDFWGGIVIGFLIGYTGSTAFESLTGIGSSGTGATS